MHVSVTGKTEPGVSSSLFSSGKPHPSDNQRDSPDNNRVLIFLWPSSALLSEQIPILPENFINWNFPVLPSGHTDSGWPLDFFCFTSVSTDSASVEPGVTKPPWEQNFSFHDAGTPKLPGSGWAGHGVGLFPAHAMPSGHSEQTKLGLWGCLQTAWPQSPALGALCGDVLWSVLGEVTFR